MPENTVYVGRPSKWGNPFVVGAPCLFGVRLDRRDAVEHFRRITIDGIDKDQLAELRGKDLACWCALDQPCHADVLLEWANAS